MSADRERSMIDELRQKVCDQKEQLDLERAKVKQIQHDKVVETRHAREQEQVKCEKEKISLKKKYLKEKNEAVNRILENLKKKDKGFGELINQKDEEIRMLQTELHVQRESDSYSSASFSKEQESAMIAELRDQFETEKARLMQSMFELRTEKVRLEEELDIIKDSDREKAIQMRQMHDQHQRDLAQIKRSSAVENRKQLEELRQVERRVMDKEKEISRKSKRLSQIEMSKEELQEKLNEQKLSERINLSMSMIDLNSSFSPQHTPPVIKPRGSSSGGLARSSSSTFSYGRLSRTSSSSSVSSPRKPLVSPASPKLGHSRPPSAGPMRVERKSQDDREKGLQQRNSELMSRVKQLEDRISNLSSENETLRQKQGQEGKKRRNSLSAVCANLEEKNQELSRQNTELQAQLCELKEAASMSVHEKALAEKLRMQEKEKLLVERTLAQLLTQSNIKLPKDIRENIENQALQMELNEAWQNEDKHDPQIVEELRAKVLEQEEDYQKLVNDSRKKEEELKNSYVELGNELSTLNAQKIQLDDQLSSTKAVMKSLQRENEELKQTASRPNPDSDKQARETRDLRNEVEMLRAEKQKLVDGEAATKQKIKLLEEVQMELVKKEEKNSRFYDEVSQKLSLVTQERNDLSQRVEEYETQRRYEAEEMASMLNDRNEYLAQLEKDKEYLRNECENYRLSNVKLESRLQKMEAKISPDNAALVNKISELEETTEVVDALKTSNDDLKNHIRQYEAEKANMKKQHNEELQRIIRTLDKKNKEHNQKSEELRSHIKRLESDLRQLEQSKMENSGNLQIKSQELHQMSEYVRKLENSEQELRAKLELYQKTTVNGGNNINSAFS